MDETVQHQIERLEDRLGKENDRRFNDVNAKLIELNTKLDSIIKDKDERKKWYSRYALGLLGAFLTGGGFLSLLQYIEKSIK